jgi:hypothetical protein
MICFHKWSYFDRDGIPKEYHGGSYYDEEVRIRHCYKCDRTEKLLVHDSGQGEIFGTYWVTFKELRELIDAGTVIDFTEGKK